MIANPIIHKEVLTSLRTRKAIAMGGLFLLVVAALIWLFWPADGMGDIGGQKARQLLIVLAISQLVMVALFAPTFTAASLTSEKERNTMESLFATALRPWEIAWGKMVGSLTFLLLLVLTGTPALAAPFLLGGVRGAEVLAILGILLLTAVYLGMIGLLVSSMMHRSYRSIIVTYGVLLVVCFFAALPAWPVSGRLITRGGTVWQSVMHIVASLSPLEAMLSLVMPASAYSQGAEHMPPIWLTFIVLGVIVIVGVALVCLVKLRRPVAPPRPREKLKVVERGQISARTFLFLIDPRKRKRMIRWWQNPVLIKEFRSRPMLQAQWLLRAMVICLIVSISLMFLISLSVQAFVGEQSGLIPSIATAVASMMTLLILFVGPAISGGTICSDRETGVWDLMRTTRISSWRMVSGKLQASIIPMLLLVGAMAPAMAVLLWFDWNMWPSVIRVLYVVGMTVVFVSAAGMFFSSIFPTTATATAWTYALVLSLGLLSLLVLLGEGLFSERFIAAVFVVNPIAAAMDAAGNVKMQQYALVSSHLKIMGAAAAVMGAVTVLRVIQLRRHD